MTAFISWLITYAITFSAVIQSRESQKCMGGNLYFKKTCTSLLPNAETRTRKKDSEHSQLEEVVKITSLQPEMLHLRALFMASQMKHTHIQKPWKALLKVKFWIAITQKRHHVIFFIRHYNHFLAVTQASLEISLLWSSWKQWVTRGGAWTFLNGIQSHHREATFSQGPQHKTWAN